MRIGISQAGPGTRRSSTRAIGSGVPNAGVPAIIRALDSSGVCEVIEALKPSVVAIEQLYSHYERPRTAILMGHARGVICLAAVQAGLEVVNYASTQVKKTLTGNGHASKVQMQHAVKFELKLDALPEPADVSDALAVALCHYYSNRDWAALAKRPAVKKS